MAKKPKIRTSGTEYYTMYTDLKEESERFYKAIVKRHKELKKQHPHTDIDQNVITYPSFETLSNDLYNKLETVILDIVNIESELAKKNPIKQLDLNFEK
jgi:hypothetical protein